MALMNMEASNTAHGVASLKDNMEGFLQEFPMWPEDRLNKLHELSGKLPNEELQNQAEKCSSEYKEVEDMFVRRQETLQRAAVRVQVRGMLRVCIAGVGGGSWLGLGDIKKIISRLLSRKLSRYSIISR